MKTFFSVFVLFVAIAAVTSHYYDYDIDAEREKMVKIMENCVKEWYRLDWEKAWSDGGPFNEGATHCIMRKTRLMDERNRLNPDKLKLFIMDEPQGFRNEKSVDQVREEVGRICNQDQNEYYGLYRTAGMVWNCLSKELRKAKLETPYTVVNFQNDSAVSHLDGNDTDAEREKMAKIIEKCIKDWYVGQDWQKVLFSIFAVPLKDGATRCIMMNMMDEFTNQLNPDRLNVFIMDEPQGFKDGKSVDEVREEIGRICSKEFNRYYATISARMILNCLTREMKNSRLGPSYTIVNPKSDLVDNL